MGGEARGISGDGSIIVGKTKPLGAFIWDASHGLRSLKSVLSEDFGLQNDLNGWVLDEAYAISLDGTTIVGTGHNAGATEAWRAVIPEPAALWLTIAPLVLLFRRR